MEQKEIKKIISNLDGYIPHIVNFSFKNILANIEYNERYKLIKPKTNELKHILIAFSANVFPHCWYPSINKNVSLIGYVSTCAQKVMLPDRDSLFKKIKLNIETPSIKIFNEPIPLNCLLYHHENIYYFNPQFEIPDDEIIIRIIRENINHDLELLYYYEDFPTCEKLTWGLDVDIALHIAMSNIVA